MLPIRSLLQIFLDGITYFFESREYYNIYFNNVYVGEMPTLEISRCLCKIPDTLPVPVREQDTPLSGGLMKDYTT